MDKTVPSGAAILLDFIRGTEVGRSDRASYDVIYGNKQRELARPLTSMSCGDIINTQKTWSKHYGSSACGGYQFLRATLIGLLRELPSIKGADIFTPDLQDRLGYHLLKRRGYEEFAAGNLPLIEFGKRLAQEWASFPVLADTKGASRNVKRGQSYYSGDGLNKALVKPEKVEAVLTRVLDVARLMRDEGVRQASVPVAQPVRQQKPIRRSGRFWTWLLTAGGSIVTALKELNLVALDWRVQMVILAIIVGFSVYAITSMPAVRHALGLK